MNNYRHLRKKFKIQKSEPGKSCQQCNVTETPEWRSGPTGPKTLCNRCGLRFAKIKRLLVTPKPESTEQLATISNINQLKEIIFADKNPVKNEILDTEE